MLKQKTNFLAIVFIIIMLLSTTCFATDAVLISAPVETSDEVELIDATSETETTDTNSEEVTTDTTTGSTDTTFNEEKYITNDYFAAEETVYIGEDVIIDGNAYIIANSVTIKGKIIGDLFVIASDLNIEGAYIYNNVFAIAEDIIIQKEGVVYSLYSISTNLTVDTEGIVYRDLSAMATNVMLRGAVGRDVNLNVDSLAIEPNESGKVIYGNLDYSSSNEATIPEGTINGEVNFNIDNKTVNQEENMAKKIISNLIKTLFVTAVIFWLLIWLAPNFAKKATEALSSKAGSVIGFGVLSFFAIPVIIFVLLISIIFLPFSILLGVFYGLLIYLSHSLLSVIIANIIVNKTNNSRKIIFFLYTLAVSAILIVLNQVPFVGPLLTLAIIVVTFGIFMNLIFKRKKEKLVEPTE